MSGQGWRAPRGEEEKRNPAETREGRGATSSLLLHRRCYNYNTQYIWSPTKADARRSRSRPHPHPRPPASRVPCPNPPVQRLPSPPAMYICLDHNGEAEAATAHHASTVLSLVCGWELMRPAFCGTGGSLVSFFSLSSTCCPPPQGPDVLAFFSSFAWPNWC